VQQVIDLTRGSATEATTLIERSTPLLALAFDPVGSTDGTDVVDTLVATERDDAATLLRVPLAGAGKPAEWSVPVPDSMTIRQLRNWALPARRMAEPAVVVKIGDRLLAHRVGAAGGWMTLAEQSAGADHLRLEVIEGHPWACWVDATMGVRLEFLR
jgi:hypothetical protein